MRNQYYDKRNNYCGYSLDGKIYKLVDSVLFKHECIGTIDHDGHVYNSFGYIGYVHPNGDVYKHEEYGTILRSPDGKIQGNIIVKNRESIGYFEGNDIEEAGAALLLGMFDYSTKMVNTLQNAGQNNTNSSTNTSSASSGSGNQPSTASDKALVFLGMIELGCVIALFLLLRKLGSGDFEYYVSKGLEISTKWFLVAIAAGVTVFIVSMKNESGTAIAISEAIIAACAYHFMCLLTQPGLVGNAFSRLISSSKWIGLVIPFFLFLPMLIDTIFLSIGSANNRKLRNSYIKMNKVFLYFSAGIITIILSIEAANEGDLWSGFWMMFFVGVFMLIWAFIFAKLEKLILPSRV